MLAIETKFLAPTNTRPARIVARVMEQRDRITNLPPRRLVMPCDERLGPEEQHRAAAALLIRRLDWCTNGYGQWISGSTPTGYVFTCNTRGGSTVLSI